MKIVGVLIAIMLILIGFGIAFAHTSSVPSTNTTLSILGTPISQNANVQWDYENGLKQNVYFNLQLQQLGGIYYENNQPIIFSTISSPNGQSTPFWGTLAYNVNDENADGTVQSYFNIAGTYSYYVTIGTENYQTVSGSWGTTGVINNQNGINYYSPVAIFGSSNTGAFFKGPLTGIVSVDISYDISYTIPLIGTYHGSGSMSRQVYIGQSGGSVSANSPVGDGQQVNITYTTTYGVSANSTNSGSPYYQLLIYGSPLYNGGSLYKTINVNPAVQNGITTFTMPSNAWQYTTNANDNNWKIVLTNGYFGIVQYTFVSVKSLNLIPPAPQIQIINLPSSGHWIWGNTVTVKVITFVNNNTKEPIQSINVWVFTGYSSTEPSTYILQDVTFAVNNNTAVFTFQIPQTTENVYIQVNSFDKGAETSNYSTTYIGANVIFRSPSQANAQSITDLILEIGFILAIVIGSVAIFYYVPVDAINKTLIVIGWIVMWIIIWGSFLVI